MSSITFLFDFIVDQLFHFTISPIQSFPSPQFARVRASRSLRVAKAIAKYAKKQAAEKK